MRNRNKDMYEDEEPTKEELREFKHNFIETGLMIVIFLFVLMPRILDFGYSNKEDRVKDRALCYSYESNPNPVLDITLGSGETYNNVKTVYIHDWDSTHWNQETHELIQRLMHLRRCLPLSRCTFSIQEDDGILTLTRAAANRSAVLVVNTTPTERGGLPPYGLTITETGN